MPVVIKMKHKFKLIKKGTAGILALYLFLSPIVLFAEDVLENALLRTRPYEENAGEAERV